MKSTKIMRIIGVALSLGVILVVVQAKCPAELQFSQNSFILRCLDWQFATKRQRNYITESSPCFKHGDRQVCFLSRRKENLVGTCVCQNPECNCPTFTGNQIEATTVPSSATTATESTPSTVTTTSSTTTTNPPAPTSEPPTTTSSSIKPGRHCSNEKVPSDTECTETRNEWCPKNPNHSLCLYCGPNMDECSEVCDRGLTEDDKNKILDLHNDLRRKVAKGQETRGVGGVGQPGARNMNELEWDDGLAETAQAWADQCMSGHDAERGDDQGWVGQNFAASWNSRKQTVKDLENMIMGWYDEVKDWPASNIEAYSTTSPTPVRGITGHYTQVVWADTKRIGCAFISNYDTRPGFMSFPFRQALVCNYSPGGNVRDRSVYEPVMSSDEVGADCPSGTLKDGLCA